MKNSDDLFTGSLDQSIHLFNDIGYISAGCFHIPCRGDLRILDADQIRCHILDCLVALQRVSRVKKRNKMSDEYENAKSRVFASTIFYG